MSSINPKTHLRLRVFAGPNGSGKSTIISSVRQYKVGSRPVDFGTYVNADDILVKLNSNSFSFKPYGIKTSETDFTSLALASGLVGKGFSPSKFAASYKITGYTLKLLLPENGEAIAQILADFLRKKLLQENKKLSFETVFSHPSKLEFMREAKKMGYKVYLYFVSTNSPEINKERVKLRVAGGGHPVPSDKIESRYYRSLDLLYDAAQLTHQTFFWDNSEEQPRLFTNFKVVNGEKKWKKIKPSEAPDWFIKYYANKVNTK